MNVNDSQFVIMCDFVDYRDGSVKTGVLQYSSTQDTPFFDSIMNYEIYMFGTANKAYERIKSKWFSDNFEPDEFINVRVGVLTVKSFTEEEMSVFAL